MKKLMVITVTLVALLFVACDLFGKKEDYFPTNVGSKWEYEGYAITESTTDAPADTVYKLTATIVAEKKDKLSSGDEVIMMIQNSEVHYYQPSETSYSFVETSYVRETKDAVLSYDTKNDTTPDTTLVLPLKEGKTWHIYENVVAKVLSQEDITVKAGTYKKAWKIEYTDTAASNYKEYFWYANNIGMAKAYGEWTWGASTVKSTVELVKATIK